MQKKIRCIALDLDRTTLKTDGTLSKRTKKALKLAVSEGVCVVIVSGRAFHTIPKEILSMDGIDYAVTSNGASVYFRENKIYGTALNRNSVEKIFDLTKELYEGTGLTYEVFVEGRPYAPADFVDCPEKYGLSGTSASYVKNTRHPVKDIFNFSAENIESIECMDLIVEDKKRYQQLLNRILAEDSEIYITSSMSYRMELSHRASGKASGLRYVLDRIGVSEDETAAFGDGENDVQMLKAAGIGIAVANAVESCRTAADRIAMANDQDGVAIEIEKLIQKN